MGMYGIDDNVENKVHYESSSHILTSIKLIIVQIPETTPRNVMGKPHYDHDYS